MHVKTVADELGGHLVGLQNRAHQTRRSVTERRHAVEEMGRVTRAGGNGLERLIVGRPGMSQRHAVAARQQPSDEIDSAIELWRERDDADIGRGAFDLAQQIGGGELSKVGRARRWWI